MRRQTTVVLSFLFVLVTGAAAQMPRPGQSYELPEKGWKPVKMAICASGESILFSAVADNPRQLVYAILQLPSGKLLEVIRSGPGDVAASTEPHWFAITSEAPAGYQLMIVDDQGTLGGLVNHPGRLWDPQFTSGGHELLIRAYAGDAARPGNPEAFTAYVNYGVYSQEFKMYSVNPPGLAMRRAPGGTGVYVFPGDGGAGLRVYDSNGNVSGSRPNYLGTTLSATGRFYVTPQEGVRSPFALIEGAMHKRLREFNRGGGKGVDGVTFLGWNPKNDQFFAAWYDTADGGRSLVVMNAESGKIARSVYRWDPAQGNPAWAWAPDGQSIAVFYNGKFSFEALKE
jgi:hypothetical protein